MGVSHAELRRRVTEVQAEARGRNLPTARLAHLIAQLLTPDPPPFRDRYPAKGDTLRIIQEQPGITPSGVAQLRGVTPRAAHDVVIRLEREGLIRTEIDDSTRYGNARRCYPAQETP